ncbi:T9SS type A sorting domain-containing protein [Psychroserpens sp. SPM9]|uniref:T9SS type A sorting domain-containing protein n=1 Tax=Psychroserpens sp. SPM9 TaxID=2975598 RepID=UPI0021A45790|nr:T9SS type A sorting domain-containing protein [Psychroserpens sp. SPM9]MDG5490069.1 T9SS type A sorting domain-containing protein [Psychroserpens sp. SPM9]
MKKITIFLLLISPFVVFSQSYYYDFDSDGDFEGFTQGGIPSLNVFGGVLEATDSPNDYTGGFQQIRTPEGLNLVESDYTIVRLVVENLLTGTSGNHETFRIVNYDIGDQNAGNAEQSSDITIPYGPGFQTLDFAIPPNSDNTGILDRIGLRIQLNVAGDLAGTLKIDQFVIVNTLSVDIATNGDFENNGGELAPWMANGPDVSASLTTGHNGGSAGRLTFDQNATTNNTLQNSYFIFNTNELEQVNQVTVNFDAQSNNTTATVGVQISHSLSGSETNQFNGNESLTNSWASYSINRSLSSDFDEIRVALRVKTNVASASLGDTFDFDNVSVIVDYYDLNPAIPAAIQSMQDGSWNDTATWVGGVIPLAGDNVVIGHVVTVNNDVAANNLTILSGKELLVNKGNSVTIEGDLVTDSGVNNSLVLRGDSNQFSSLIVKGTSTGDIRFRRYVNDVEASAGNDLIASPVSMASFNDFYTDNASFFVEDTNSDAVLFGPFNNAGNPGVYENWDFDATTPLIPGVGYRMGTNGDLAETSALNFHGSIITTDVSVGITSETGNFGNWNLIGNPYTSYITLADFLAANNSEFDVTSSGVYGYDNDTTGDGSKWTIWNQAYSDANPNTLITPGQGFFVASKNGGGTVDFTTDMRTIGDSDDFILGRNQQSNHLGDFTLKLTSNANSYTTDIYFNTNGTSELDAGYDATHFGQSVSGFALYSTLVDYSSNSPLAIQTLGPNEITQTIIPLGVNAGQGEQITFTLSNLNLPNSTMVYIEDTELNSFTLLNDSDYIITPNTNLNGTGRFFLRVGDNALSTIQNEISDILIFSNNKSIMVHGYVSDNSILRLYDIQGRLMQSFALEPSLNQQTVEMHYISSGIYVVQIGNEGKNVTKKIIID